MRRARGTTVIEVLVAASVFLLIIGAVVLVYRNSLVFERHNAANSRAYRAVMLALKHVESNLHGAQLLLPSAWNPEADPVSSIDVIYPTRVGSEVVVDSTGTPVWAGRASLRLEPGGRFVKVEGDTTRLLADLGQGGSITFLRPARDLLVVRARADVAGSEGSFEFEVTLRLRNQP